MIKPFLSINSSKMMSMQRMQMVLGWQVLILLCVGSYVWSRQIPDDYDLRRLYSYAYKRYPGYDFGLGKRSLEEPASYEDTGYPYPLDSYTALMNPSAAADKRASPSGMYSFGLGKRNQQRYYGFGLGKRLEQAWRGVVQPSASMFPSYRQERRSKIYSFGLGKRQSPDLPEDDYEFPGAAAAMTDKRASQARQFSFGLGKRDTESSGAASSSDHVKSTS